ncbi:MAG: response regulator, partial [Bacteroidota bacterium]|nr:response regulator [Bacteroidota bacterium]
WACISQAQRALGQFEDALLSRVKEDSCENVYQTMDRENENDLDGLEVLEWENRRKQRMQENQYKLQEERQTYLYAIVALLIGFAMFITYRYRFTQRQSQLISTQRQQLADRQRELIKANSDLEIALNHKAVFLSNMSHEIRTPLNAIVGMSNLATKEDMTTGARKYLRNIVIASSNLIDIVNDILDFSKLEAGKLEIAEEPFSVADALEVAENVMRISAEQKDLTFTVDAADNLPSHLMGDSSRLNQVLINLIGNAIKFTLEGGVTLCAEVAPLPTLPGWCPPPPKAHDEWFVVRVKDTGIGIPNDKQEKIFESFNQGDQLKTRKFGGTGLGLSISKQIVELQGGVIWVESVEGEGSTFCFALPALHAEGIAEEDHEEDADREIGPIRILIAEDNPFNVIVTEDTLKAELKEVTIGKAENGKVAFEKVRDEEWDLVLMDIHMPEMSGLEATAAIRKLPDADKARTLIVAMTASVLREETDNYMRHGMDGFVPKPFQADQLKNEIFRLQKDRKKEANPEQTSLPPLRILIAEDNPFNVIVAEDTLRTEIPNVTIGKAENGKVAMEMVRDEEWDIVLMDIAMPEMTGIEATLAIRKLEDAAKADTTIIAMTASVLKEDTDHYLKQGMNGFVPKPFKVGQLLSEVEKAHLSRKK